MAGDWDLWAVVRGCYNPPAASATAAANNTNYVSPPKDPKPVSASLVSGEDDNPFDILKAYGRRNNGFEELDEVYRTFFSSSQSINPTTSPTLSFLSVLGGFNHQQVQELSKPLPHFMTPNIMDTCCVSVLHGFNDQEEEEQKPHLINPTLMDVSSISVLRGFNDQEEEKPRLINPTMTPMPFSSVLGESTKHQPWPQPRKQQFGRHIPQPPKPNIVPVDQYGYQRKRSQPTAVVEVEAENLPEVDPWNWRKYGRKAIKSSPYPRNYYKCSSKGNKCQAKKYVEKSQSDPEKFRVSYNGEHDHSLPRRRRSSSNALSFSTTTPKKASCSSSAPPSLASHASTAPLTSATKDEDALHGAVKIKMEVDEDAEGMSNSENVFMGLQDLAGGGRSETSANAFDWSWAMNDDFSLVDLLSPSVPNTSTTTAGDF